MLRQWTAVYHYEWTPIITFARRRLQLLDWLEEHTSPVAFTESHSTVGVAYVAEDLRIAAHAKGLTIVTGFSEVPIDSLADPLQGIFDIMEPKSALLSHFKVLVTADLADARYSEVTAEFGRRTSFPVDEMYRPSDSSALVDVDSVDVRFQVEWGVVNHDEILLRLTDPEMGRIESSRPALDERGVEYIRADEEAPDVAVLADVQGWTKTGGGVADSATVLQRVAEADAHAAALVTRLYAGVINDKEKQ